MLDHEEGTLLGFEVIVRFLLGLSGDPIVVCLAPDLVLYYVVASVQRDARMG
jgi:hypothetical protein